MTVLGAHPARLDLYVHPGDPIDFGLPVLNGAGLPVTLTGWTATATVRDPAGQLLYDFAPYISSNQIRVSANPTATATWAWTVYAGRLTVTATPPGGGPETIAAGWIRLYR